MAGDADDCRNNVANICSLAFYLKEYP